MTSTTVQYINPNHDSKETKDSQKDIKVFYLKATIVILTLALATVSGILIWKLLANDFEQKAKAVSFEFIFIRNLRIAGTFVLLAW